MISAGLERRLHLSVHPVGAGYHPGAWRWPGADPLAFSRIEGYLDVARTAERGRLDSIFLADVPGIHTDIDDYPVLNGLEPTLILTAMAVVTERIGLVGTASTNYNEPFNIARRFRALDLLSHGRAGWNAVTTSGPRIADNFVAREPTTAERYARAEEFVAVVTALWDSWDDDVLVADIDSGRYADMSRLQPIDHHGEHFDVRGPLNLPPSEQGRPVIYHAGVSDDVFTLTARTGEAMFTAARDLASTAATIGEIRDRAERFGRPRDAVRFLPGLVTSIGSTEAEARSRWDRLEQLAGPHAGGAGHLRAVGAPEQVAELIERWFRSGVVDGFTLMPDVTADGLPAFVDHVVPILQARGVFRRDYEGRTLREHYGLPLPTRAGASA